MMTIRLKDNEGNYLRQDDDGHMLCNHSDDCPQMLTLHGRGDVYDWECRVHGKPKPPTDCPTCKNVRSWVFPYLKGMAPFCQFCADGEAASAPKYQLSVLTTSRIIRSIPFSSKYDAQRERDRLSRIFLDGDGYTVTVKEVRP